ncbi:hypothetical protein CDCA_CDCA05G1634 [Cyanidium caldarium]|uniref:Uncharacterized protein n=1 Tax=Cyanidium caldarium TaxID=2771 RepID=A0AAV9ITY3_CYACA|nr:hypothetical protein CDCA_CDCA05G1634 [Cyanidium caldarium]
MFTWGWLRRTAVLWDGRVRFARPKRRPPATVKANARKRRRLAQRNAQVLREGEQRLAVRAAAAAAAAKQGE